MRHKEYLWCYSCMNLGNESWQIYQVPRTLWYAQTIPWLPTIEIESSLDATRLKNSAWNCSALLHAVIQPYGGGRQCTSYWTAVFLGMSTGTKHTVFRFLPGRQTHQAVKLALFWTHFCKTWNGELFLGNTPRGLISYIPYCWSEKNFCALQPRTIPFTILDSKLPIKPNTRLYLTDICTAFRIFNRWLHLTYQVTNHSINRLLSNSVGTAYALPQSSSLVQMMSSRRKKGTTLSLTSATLVFAIANPWAPVWRTISNNLTVYRHFTWTNTGLGSVSCRNGRAISNGICAWLTVFRSYAYNNPSLPRHSSSKNRRLLLILECVLTMVLFCERSHQLIPIVICTRTSD